jgi:hypothetical protein
LRQWNPGSNVTLLASRTATGETILGAATVAEQRTLATFFMNPDRRISIAMALSNRRSSSYPNLSNKMNGENQL